MLVATTLRFDGRQGKWLFYNRGSLSLSNRMIGKAWMGDGDGVPRDRWLYHSSPNSIRKRVRDINAVAPTIPECLLINETIRLFGGTTDPSFQDVYFLQLSLFPLDKCRFSLRENNVSFQICQFVIVSLKNTGENRLIIFKTLTVLINSFSRIHNFLKLNKSKLLASNKKIPKNSWTVKRRWFSKKK